ncbi:uncharacterized protein LOC120511637 [Passer montanus]|uniref:uncharacterized protein LOC120511637 n=1 Tax=Passer montanus TaxID=9160 RepID=UPI00196071AF|nr:uncharacterized protein LOC120511637 [Passer montanus]
MVQECWWHLGWSWGHQGHGSGGLVAPGMGLVAPRTSSGTPGTSLRTLGHHSGGLVAPLMSLVALGTGFRGVGGTWDITGDMGDAAGDASDTAEDIGAISGDTGGTLVAPLVALLALGTLWGHSGDIGTDYWLYARARVCNATNASAAAAGATNALAHGGLTHSGLWRVCCLEGLKRGLCLRINHFPEDLEYDHDSAEYLLRVVRASSIFPILSAVLLLLGGLCVAASRLRRARTSLVLGAGILFVAAGLSNIIGVIVYISANAGGGAPPGTPGAPPPPGGAFLTLQGGGGAETPGGGTGTLNRRTTPV